MDIFCISTSAWSQHWKLKLLLWDILWGFTTLTIPTHISELSMVTALQPANASPDWKLPTAPPTCGIYAATWEMVPVSQLPCVRHLVPKPAHLSLSHLFSYSIKPIFKTDYTNYNNMWTKSDNINWHQQWLSCRWKWWCWRTNICPEVARLTSL